VSEQTHGSRPTDEVVRLDVPIGRADDLAILRGALLSARATELGELRRRAGRHSLGYGSDSARESMDDDVRRLRRRIELLDALIAAIDAAP
jgi:hypothetical protein